MDNPEEVMQILERFNVQKNPEINPILEEYLQFVARTGDSVYAWALVKNLFREKLINVITDFYNETPIKDLPQYPNVDPFNYDTMKTMLLEKLDSFQSAPFTIQRISELLSEPRKQYSRVDKFMRAVEKTILVVSTIPPGRTRTESSDSLDSGLNGDFSDVNVDVDMDGQDHPNLNHKKNNNHDEKHESPAVAAASKHDEDDESKEESVKGTITKVTVDSVSITVIEPERSKTDETPKEQSPTKAEDPSLNAPIRSSENEILVETTEIISETPPLAALENIVATTTVKVDSTIMTPDIVITSSSSSTSTVAVTTEQTEPADYVESDETETAVKVSDESSETEAKRIKLSEETEATSLAPTETSEKADKVCEKTEDDAETPEMQSSESSETPSTSSSSETETSQEETSPLPAVESKPTPVEEVPETAPSTVECEKVDVDEPTPVEVVPIEVQETVTDDASVVAEMDAAPTPPPLTESKMDDEEQSTTAAAAPVEQEMTPVASKMDTDESTTVEAAPMEFEDGAEPMDDQ